VHFAAAVALPAPVVVVAVTPFAAAAVARDAAGNAASDPLSASWVAAATTSQPQFLSHTIISVNHLLEMILCVQR
jgi:hypothetical protein